MLSLSRKRRALGASTRTVAGIGFYLHKECRAGEIWILSTQRIPRARGSDVDLHKRFMGPWFNTNLVNKMGAVINTTSALRALVLQNLFKNNEWILNDRQNSMIDGA